MSLRLDALTITNLLARVYKRAHFARTRVLNVYSEFQIDTRRLGERLRANYTKQASTTYNPKPKI